MLEWISYTQKDIKRVREAGNGLKSNSTTDHRGVHKKNLSVIENKRARRGVASSRSTITRYEKTHLVLHISGSELEVAHLTGIKHAKAELRVCEEKKSFKAYPADSATF